MTDAANTDVGRSLEAALRAGFSLRQAFVRLARDYDSLTSIARLAEDDAPLTEVIDAWDISAGDDATALYAAACRLQLADHGNLADKLGFVTRLLEVRRPVAG